MLLPFLMPVVLAVAMPMAPEKRPPPTTEEVDEPEGVAVNVQWSGVHATDGCFFFSGPAGLGRDDALGDRACVVVGGRASASFGGATFTGVGGRLTRQSTHDFDGPWTVTEALTGALSDDGAFSGTYAYRECEKGRQCPGRCRIEATVSWVPVGRCGSSK